MSSIFCVSCHRPKALSLDSAVGIPKAASHVPTGGCGHIAEVAEAARLGLAGGFGLACASSPLCSCLPASIGRSRANRLHDSQSGWSSVQHLRRVMSHLELQCELPIAQNTHRLSGAKRARPLSVRNDMASYQRRQMPVSHLLVAGAALVLQTIGCGAIAVKVRPGLCHLRTESGFQTRAQMVERAFGTPITCSEWVAQTGVGTP